MAFQINLEVEVKVSCLTGPWECEVAGIGKEHLPTEGPEKSIVLKVKIKMADPWAMSFSQLWVSSRGGQSAAAISAFL